MVLGGRPPGRVGRRPISIAKAPPGREVRWGFRRFPARLPLAWRVMSAERSNRSSSGRPSGGGRPGGGRGGRPDNRSGSQPGRQASGRWSVGSGRQMADRVAGRPATVVVGWRSRSGRPGAGRSGGGRPGDRRQSKGDKFTPKWREELDQPLTAAQQRAAEVDKRRGGPRPPRDPDADRRWAEERVTEEWIDEGSVRDVAAAAAARRLGRTAAP